MSNPEARVNKQPRTKRRPSNTSAASKVSVGCTRSPMALSVSEIKYRALMDNANDAILVATPEGTLLDANKKAVALFGCEKEELLALSVDRLHPADTLPTVLAAFRQMLRDGSGTLSDALILRKDGESVPVDITGSVVRFEEETILVGIFRDVSGRLAIEKALRESEAKYRAVVEDQTELICRYLPDGTLTFVNGAYCRYFGKTPEQLIGRTFFPMIPPEDIAAVQEALRSLSCDNPVVTHTHRVISPDGTTRWQEWTNRVMYDKDGRSTECQAVGRDVTERIHTERILEARFRLSEFAGTHTLDELLQKTLDEAEILTNSSFGFFHFLEEDQTTLSLQAWSTNTLQHMCAVDGREFHHAVDGAGVWAKCVRERRPVIYNDYARLPHRKGTPSGHSPVMREAVVPVFRGERIVAILGVGNKPNDYDERDIEVISQLANLTWDVVLRTSAEEALRESEERFRTVADFTYDWEYWIRPDEKYLYVSPSCERVTGYRQDEFMQDSMLLEKIAHPDDLAALQRHFKQDLECNEPLFLDFRITTKSGAQRWISHMCQQVRSRDGRPLGRRASNRDITERKKSEERQAELIAALEAANRELDEFAHVVSHDLKAPLRAINNLATWLIADLGDTLDSRGKERLDMLSHKAKHLHSLIEGILEYSRAGKTREALTEVDVAALLAHVVSMLAPPSGVVVIINEMPTVVCEKTRLAQIFQNLLGNALQFLDKPDGRIEVNCYPSPDGHFWTFCVADNGPGIEEKHFDRIFLPFQTLTHRPGSESTGIGLALVKKIVEMYGGRIWVESTPGQGSTLSFTIPRSRGHDAQQHDPSC